MPKPKLIGINGKIKENIIVGIAAGLLFVTVSAIANLSPMALPFGLIALLSMISAFIVVAVLAPIVEEPIMAVVLHIFRSVTSNVIVTVLLTSFVFAAFHMSVYGVSNLDFFIGAFVFRILACILIIKQDSILPAMIMHSIANIYLFMLYY